MFKDLWQKTVQFHGHECPGLALGFKACEAAIDKMGLNFSTDEEIVCVTENDACGVDAIQYILGCTLGKGNLIYRGRGKMAFNFFNRKNGESLRMIAKPKKKDMNREDYQEYLLNAPVDELFTFSKPNFELPEEARLFDSITCENCGEETAENKIRLQDGKKVCLDCYKDYSRWC